MTTEARMNRRQFLGGMTVAAAGAMFGQRGFGASAQGVIAVRGKQGSSPMKKPNIVLFNPDEWRGDVAGYLGNPAAMTPNLDRVVREDGVAFAQAFCQNGVCTPSRCSFMTGWYPHVGGHRTMSHLLHPADGEPNLLRVLKANDYFVWWGGKNDLLVKQDDYRLDCDVRNRGGKSESMWMLNRSAEWRGAPGDPRYYSFLVGRLPHSEGKDHYHDHDWAQVQAAAEFIRSYDGKKPFCLYLPLTYPHPPYAVEDPWFSAIDRAKLPPRPKAPPDWRGKPVLLGELARRQNLGGFDEAWWTELRAVYYGMCARVDAQFALIVQALRDKGLYDDTALLFFPDHGDFAGDFGLVEKTQNTFEEGLVRVPFVVKPPRGIACRPGVRQALVELVDVPATVYDLAGVDPGYEHFGRSVLPVVAGGADEHRDAVFAEGGRLSGEKQAMEQESYNRSPDPKTSLYWPRISLQVSDEKPWHGKAAMCRTHDTKYVYRLYEAEELYDLKKDPLEERNVAGDPAYASTLESLRRRLLCWHVETADVVPMVGDARDA
jgi:arylsulfatase A-like enzyme